MLSWLKKNNDKLTISFPNVFVLCLSTHYALPLDLLPIYDVWFAFTTQANHTNHILSLFLSQAGVTFFGLLQMLQ